MNYKLILANKDFRAGMFEWVQMLGKEYAVWKNSTIYFSDEQDLLAFKLKFGL